MAASWGDVVEIGRFVPFVRSLWSELLTVHKTLMLSGISVTLNFNRREDFVNRGQAPLSA